MTIAQLIAKRDVNVAFATITMSVRDAVDLLSDKRIGALPVMDGHAIAGILSERDVIRRLSEHGPALLDLTVGQIMTSPAITVDPGTDILEALGLMTQRRVRHLPVLKDGRMVDFISIGDLVKYRIDRIQSEAEAMRNYIQMA
ncbi:CBS domain-containing protein [Novosphingobium umbonatum]|uniref:CBS domain-containing protein n=1 Tax=Novosphingobium umbonatum TaxID=1908524 RepID=A0A437N553_9SPHN|nr:CBS domain-containing protein [Novosphingobium umbonatum]RVU05040.1 CBS domain-containing protein [Novosphingobium umbonatum]